MKYYILALYNPGSMASNNITAIQSRHSHEISPQVAWARKYQMGLDLQATQNNSAYNHKLHPPYF